MLLIPSSASSLGQGSAMENQATFYVFCLCPYIHMTDVVYKSSHGTIDRSKGVNKKM